MLRLVAEAHMLESHLAPRLSDLPRRLRLLHTGRLVEKGVQPFDSGGRLLDPSDQAHDSASWLKDETEERLHGDHRAERRPALNHQIAAITQDHEPNGEGEQALPA